MTSHQRDMTLEIHVHPRYIDTNFDKYMMDSIERILIGEYIEGEGYISRVLEVIEIGPGIAPLYSVEILFKPKVMVEYIIPAIDDILEMELGELKSLGAFMNYNNLFKVFVSLSRMPSSSSTDRVNNLLYLADKKNTDIVAKHTLGSILKVRVLNLQTSRGLHSNMSDGQSRNALQIVGEFV